MESPCLVIRGASNRSSKYPAVICVAAGKPFSNIRDAVVFPHFDRARIKALNRMPDGRFVVELKGVPRRRLQPGALLIDGGEPLVRSRSGYGISLRPIPAGVYQARGGVFRGHTLPGTLTVTPVSSGYRLAASADLPLVPGASYRLLPVEPQGIAARRTAAGSPPADRRASGNVGTDTDGPKRRPLPHELLLCIPVEPAKSGREVIGPALSQIRRAVSARRIAAVNLGVLGWAFLPARIGLHAVEDELRKLEGSLRAAADDAFLELGGRGGPKVGVSRSFFERVTVEIQRALKKAGGEKVEAISRLTGYPVELVRVVTEELERTEDLARESGVLMPAGAHAGLSPIEKGVLESLRAGFESKGFARGGKGFERQVLEKLVGLHLAVRIGDRYCAMDTFEALVERLLRGRNPGETIELARAREMLGLPREQTVQLLEFLDREGLLRREEHVHRIVKGPRSRR